MGRYSDSVTFESLKGKTLTGVTNHGDSITFLDSEGNEYTMEHHQNCCEHVSVESITGDLGDLIGNEILLAEESTQDDDGASESGMWTFYKLATIKGYVDIRWYGSSNGYYSVGVSFTMTKKEEE